MNYKLFSYIFVTIVIISIVSVVYAATDTTIIPEAPEEMIEESDLEIEEEINASQTTQEIQPKIIEQQITQETNDYTEYFITIIDLMNLLCACMIVASIIIVLTIISMRWI